MARTCSVVTLETLGHTGKPGETTKKSKGLISSADFPHTDLGVPFGSKFGEKKNRHRQESGDLGVLRVPTDKKLPPLGGSTGNNVVRLLYIRSTHRRSCFFGKEICNTI